MTSIERFSCYRGYRFGDGSDYFVDFARRKDCRVIEHETFPKKATSNIFILNVTPQYVNYHSKQVEDLITSNPETTFYVFDNDLLKLPEFPNLKSINLSNKVRVDLLEDLGADKNFINLLRGGQTQ